ncbi:MAG: hypothetical protein WCF65_03700 [Parachlamydiaceae bacterium]
MFHNIGVFRDLYNRVYLSLSCWVISKRDQKGIDTKVQECVEALDLNSNNLSLKCIRKIKVCIVKEFLAIPSKIDTKCLTINYRPPEGVSRRVTDACNNASRKLSLQWISQEKLVPKKQPDFLVLKQKCYEGIINSQSPDDAQIISYLKCDEIKNLAKKIDKDIVCQLTFQNFAKLLLDYQQEIRKVVYKPGKDAPGADIFCNTYFALILLMKNDQFPDAVVQLNEYAHQNNGPYGYIESACLQYLGGIKAIGLNSCSEGSIPLSLPTTIN